MQRPIALRCLVGRGQYVQVTLRMAFMGHDYVQWGSLRAGQVPHLPGVRSHPLRTGLANPGSSG